MTNQGLGRRGEELAAAFLARRGYEVLARNVRLASGELDLVAQEGRVTVFVEVKGRSGRAFGRPGEAVDQAKQRRLTLAAQEWLQAHDRLDQPARFDVVEIFWDRPGQERVALIKNAFEASE